MWSMEFVECFDLCEFTYYAICVLVLVYRYDFARRGVTVVKTTFHWHAHAVGDLCFTTDGQ